MSIDLNDLWLRFCSDNNTFQGGMLRPARDYERLVNSISQDFWNEWTLQDEKTQEIIDNLSPFANTINIIVGSGDGNYGIAKYPKQYGRWRSARSLWHEQKCMCEQGSDVYENGECITNETELQKIQRIERYKDGIVETQITKVENSHWANCLAHKTKCPTVQDPKLTQYAGGFKVAPRQVSVIVLDFYVQPKYAKFAYTIAPGNPQTGAGDYIVYNQGASGKLEWPETMIPYFLKELQKKYAKFTRDATLFQMNKG